MVDDPRHSSRRGRFSARGDCAFHASRMAFPGPLAQPPATGPDLDWWPPADVSTYLFGSISRLKYGRMDRILAVGRAVRDVLIHSGVDPHKIALVHER